jgi:hypothetical protein
MLLLILEDLNVPKWDPPLQVDRSQSKTGLDGRCFLLSLVLFCLQEKELQGLSIGEVLYYLGNDFSYTTLTL